MRKGTAWAKDRLLAGAPSPILLVPWEAILIALCMFRRLVDDEKRKEAKRSEICKREKGAVLIFTQVRKIGPASAETGLHNSDRSN
jgi:hypothetical protein